MSVGASGRERYLIDDTGSIQYLTGADDDDRAAAQAERMRRFGDSWPWIVDDANVTLDQSAGRVDLGGLRFEHPAFRNSIIPPKTQIRKSGSLPRDLPVLNFLEVFAEDIDASNQVGDLIAFKVGMAVLTQTTMVTDSEIRARRVAQMKLIHGATVNMFSGSVGRFRHQNQCWLDVFRDGRGEHGLLVYFLSFAGPDVASSSLVVFDIYGGLTNPFTKSFVRSLVLQACGALPGGFDDAVQ